MEISSYSDGESTELRSVVPYLRKEETSETGERRAWYVLYYGFTLVISFVLNSHAAPSRNELQAELTSLTTSQSSSSAEVGTLRRRVEDVESCWCH